MEVNCHNNSQSNLFLHNLTQQHSFYILKDSSVHSPFTTLAYDNFSGAIAAWRDLTFFLFTWLWQLCWKPRTLTFTCDPWGDWSATWKRGTFQRWTLFCQLFSTHSVSSGATPTITALHSAWWSFCRSSAIWSLTKYVFEEALWDSRRDKVTLLLMDKLTVACLCSGFCLPNTRGTLQDGDRGRNRESSDDHLCDADLQAIVPHPPAADSQVLQTHPSHQVMGLSCYSCLPALRPHHGKTSYDWGALMILLYHSNDAKKYLKDQRMKSLYFRLLPNLIF